MVRNQASACSASALRVARGASSGLMIGAAVGLGVLVVDRPIGAVLRDGVVGRDQAVAGVGQRRRRGLSPASSAAIAAAQICPCECAAEAERGMAPAMAASPMTWMFGCSLDSNVTGSTGHQPVRSATPASSATRPAFCGGMTLATAALYLSKSVTSVLVAASTDDQRAAVRQPDPFDHAGIKLLPGRLEQLLHGEAFLGVEHDHLGARLFASSDSARSGWRARRARAGSARD